MGEDNVKNTEKLYARDLLTCCTPTQYNWQLDTFAGVVKQRMAGQIYSVTTSRSVLWCEVPSPHEVQQRKKGDV